MTENTVKTENETKIVQTRDGQVHITQPKGRRHRGVTVLFDTDDVVREQVGGFANFLREYAVVGLAIGFIVGQQANAVVKELVNTFVDPVVKVWFGQDLSHRSLTVHHGSSPIPIPWGALVYSLIEFFLVVITLYLFIKLFKLDKLQKHDKPADTKK